MMLACVPLHQQQRQQWRRWVVQAALFLTILLFVAAGAATGFVFIEESSSSSPSFLSLRITTPRKTTTTTTAPISTGGRSSWAKRVTCDPHREKKKTTTIALFAKRASATKKKKAKKQSGGATGGGKKKKTNNAAGGGFGGGGFGKSSGRWDGCEGLKAWLLEQEGCEIDPGLAVGVVDPVVGLRGVKACRDYQRGDVLFSVPRDRCILDETKAADSPVGKALFPTISERNALPPPVRTALLLLYCERLPADSDERKALWSQAAFDALPTPEEFRAEGGPMELWSDEELAMVECPQLIGEIHKRSTELRRIYDDIVVPKWTTAASSAAEEESSSSGPLVGMPLPSFEEFQHAVCVLTSRNFGHGDPSEGSSSMLVPGVDLCNHDDPDICNTKHALAPWGNFVVLASKNIKKDEQVLLTYGPLPNRVLLAQFGFMLCDRTTTNNNNNNKPPLISDTAIVRIDPLLVEPPPPPSDTTTSIDGSTATTRRRTVQSVLEEEKAADAAWDQCSGLGTFINLKGANRRDDGRLSRWQPAAVARKAADLVAASSSAANADTTATTTTGRDLFERLLNRELSSYSTTLRQDEEQLLRQNNNNNNNEEESSSMSPRSMWALRFRIETKRLLVRELETLQAK